MRTVHLHNQQLQLVHSDCLPYLKSLADNSVDLIVTDPPYFQVKKNAWDNQWPDVTSFLAWLDEVTFELYRVLAPAGSLYLFCGSKLAAETELLIKTRFDVLNHIVWAKPSGVWRRAHKPSLRKFFPATERIIFASHYGAEGVAKGQGQYHTQCQTLKKTVFAPLIHYFKQAKAVTGISASAINEATGTQMCSHWFSDSQWKLPSAKQYQCLQRLFEQHSRLERSHDSLLEEQQALNRQYQHLVKEYDDLKEEYQRLRRPFQVSADVPYTDVWDFAPVQYYPNKHPCEKPLPMLEHMIQLSSREGDVVLDPFMGSGSTGKACLSLNRAFIGIEQDEARYRMTLDDFQ